MQFLFDNVDLLVRAFLTTLGLSALAGLLAVVLGTLLAAARVSPIPPLRGLATFYVEVFRNTPLTVVFFFLIFGLPQIDFVIGFFPGAVLSLGLYTAAFVCEAVRSGINAVSVGQAEAARAVGMTFGQTLRLVVLPQAIRSVIPPLASILIALAKNTAIAEAFGLVEATGRMDNLVRDFPTALYPLFFGTAAGYIVIVLAIAVIARVLERRLVVLR